MSIPSKRFEFLDKETNVGLADFKNVDATKIFNSVNNEIKTIDAQFGNFLTNITGKLDINGMLNTVQKTVGEAANGVINKLGLSNVGSAVGEFLQGDLVRNVRGAIGSVMDLTGLSPKDLEKVTASYFMDQTPQQQQVSQNALGRLSQECRTSMAGGSTGYGKPYDQTISCGSNTNKTGGSACSSSEIANVINRVTNGQYNATYSNLNGKLKSLIDLTKISYDANLCGVFNALSTGVDKNVKARASGALLTHLGATGNMEGVIDLAGASAGLQTSLEAPNGVRGVFDHFQIPASIRENGLPEFNNNLFDAVEVFKDNWLNSSIDEIPIPSIEALGNYKAPLSTMLRSNVMTNVTSVNNLDQIFDAPKDIIGSAFSSLFA